MPVHAEPTPHAPIDSTKNKEETFVSESLAQRLRFPRHSSFVLVSGVGGACCQTVRSCSALSVHLDYLKRWRVNALILSPTWRRRFFCRRTTELADPRPHLDDAVDLSIGADLFLRLILSGLKRRPDAAVVAQATKIGWVFTDSLMMPANALLSTSSISIAGYWTSRLYRAILVARGNLQQPRIINLRRRTCM